MTNEYNPDGKEIRFIDSHYKDLFHIPDGSCVQIHYPDEMVVKPCTFIDEYHTQIGYNVFHICQFAEIMERNGASYMPEPEIMGDEAAWKVGKDRPAVQTCEDGYDYTLLDENYNEIDGGQVDNPELSMLEVRRDILESFGWSAGNCGQCSMRMSWSRLLKSADRRWWSMTLSLSLLLSSTVLQRTSTPMNIWIRSMMCRRISKKSRQILPLVIRLRIVSS